MRSGPSLQSRKRKQALERSNVGPVDVTPAKMQMDSDGKPPASAVASSASASTPPASSYPIFCGPIE
jgi:hypothetical protein